MDCKLGPKHPARSSTNSFEQRLIYVRYAGDWTVLVWVCPMKASCFPAPVHGGRTTALVTADKDVIMYCSFAAARIDRGNISGSFSSRAATCKETQSCTYKIRELVDTRVQSH